ncbi:MAG: hypothetical protein AAGF83_27475 [Cyanobacteria bacterium P01_G01_bin.67]
MLSEVKAEIIKLIGNKTFSRNLSLTLLVAIAILSTLADLQSQKTQLAEQMSIISISRSNTMKIIVERN